jgi:hypothetical protein
MGYEPPPPPLIDVTTIDSTEQEFQMGMPPRRNPSGPPPRRGESYTPAVHRFDWLRDLRATRRQAMVGAVLLAGIVLAAGWALAPLVMP